MTRRKTEDFHMPLDAEPKKSYGRRLTHIFTIEKHTDTAGLSGWFHGAKSKKGSLLRLRTDSTFAIFDAKPKVVFAR